MLRTGRTGEGGDAVAVGRHVGEVTVNKNFTKKCTALRGGAAFQALVLVGAGFAIPAYAQDATAGQTVPATTAVPSQTAEDDQALQGDDVVVTGSIFRRTNTETPSPVTVLTAQNLQSRGLVTIADAVQTLSAGNGGGIPQNFTGAFASGSTSISLRGLTTNSTLTLFDGLRAAPYPLADDGQRSFVDLNTIPSAIVDRIEVLKDGASSTYGADAIAGVVNIILKKEIKGIEGRVEAGTAQRGYAGNQRVQLTAGYGDLSEQGFNVYMSGEYQHVDKVVSKDVRFPYNTNNLLSIDAGNGFTGRNGNFGFTPPAATSSSGATVGIVRPGTISPARTDIPFATAIAGGQFQVLGSCASQNLTTRTNSTGSYCEQDLVNQYGVISPEQTRFGGTVHATANIGSAAQAYFVGTFYQSKVTIDGTPQSIRSNGNPVETRGIALPARLSNGQPNPQNPFAAQNQAAIIYYRFGDIPTSLTNISRTYRAATGIDGTFGTGWGYSASATYMRTDLDQNSTGLLYVPGLAAAINNGTYNFVNPSLNTQAVRDSISRPLNTRASSDLWQVQALVTKDIVEIVPGSPIQLGVGGQVRYEDINDPTRVPNRDFITVNPFQAVGNRYIYAGFFELNAPLLESLEVNASGRYDKYSDVGFSRFSPKIGAKFTPIRQIAVRGTYSQGFRAPSIPEVSGSVIGFTQYIPGTGLSSADQATLAGRYQNNSYITTQYGLGNNSTGNPDIQPETSRSFTGGVVLQPTPWLSLTVDYYNIEKKNLILGAAGNPALIASQYLLTGVIPAGVGITLNPTDPNNPTLRATPLSVDFLYANGNSLLTDGIDVEVNLSWPITDNVKLTSIFSGTRINRYNIDDGTGSGIQKFVGTLASYAVTSASGTPRYRANWQNTVEAGPFSLSGTAYYTSGYEGYADDNTGPGSTCDQAIETSARYSADLVTTTAGPPLACSTKSFLQFDVVTQFKVNDNFTFYLNVINAFDVKAPFDPNTYGGNNYNPAWSSAGVIGRAFRGGATFKF
jgi:iron complex outermembrane receptor protein